MRVLSQVVIFYLGMHRIQRHVCGEKDQAPHQNGCGHVHSPGRSNALVSREPHWVSCAFNIKCGGSCGGLRKGFAVGGGEGSPIRSRHHLHNVLDVSWLWQSLAGLVTNNYAHLSHEM